MFHAQTSYMLNQALSTDHLQAGSSFQKEPGREEYRVRKYRETRQKETNKTEIETNKKGEKTDREKQDRHRDKQDRKRDKQNRNEESVSGVHLVYPSKNSRDSQLMGTQINKTKPKEKYKDRN